MELTTRPRSIFNRNAGRMPRRDAPQDVRHDGLRLHNDERGTAVREKCDSAGVLVCKRKSRRRTTDAPRQTRNCGASVRERFCPRSYREKGNPATSTELRRNMDSEMVRGGAAPQGFAPHAPLCGSIFIYGIIRIPTHRPMTETGRLNDRLAARTAAGQLFILPQERFYCKKAGSRRQVLPRSQRVLASLCLQRRKMTFRILLRGRSSPPRSRARTNGSRAFLFENVDPAKVGYKKDESYAPSKGRHRNGKHAKKNP